MIIYDLRSQSLIDFIQILIGCFFIVFGLFAFFLLSKYKPSTKQNWYTDFFGLSKNDIENKVRMFPKAAKMMGIITLMAAGIIFTMQTKNYVYIKYINYFEKINSCSARIDSVKTSSLFGGDYINIYIKDQSFNIVRDSRYVSNRNLLTNDSIKIDYFDSDTNKKYFINIGRIELNK